jgi:ABC-2 type transport system ATP-binding protein
MSHAELVSATHRTIRRQAYKIDASRTLSYHIDKRMLQFINYKKSYGTYPALQIPDIKLDTGIYWVKGVNGSGKSTLLKSIAGILSFEGDILLDGVSIKKQAVEYRQLVNFSEAEPLFPGFITGMEMINLFASAKNGPKGQEQDLIESMKMQSYVDRPIGTYSSGMLKKLGLLLAFLGRPKIILLDEPLITIDTASLQILYTWMADAYRNHGTMFLLTSHQALDAAELPEAAELLVQNQTLNFIA